MSSNNTNDTSSSSEDDDFHQLLIRRFFIVPSFEIYGGFSGCYDYGPPTCSIKNNILQLWRQHFIRDEENVHEMDGSSLTMECVLSANGHLQQHSDWMAQEFDFPCHSSQQHPYSARNNYVSRVDRILENFIETELDENSQLLRPEQFEELYLAKKKIRSSLAGSGDEEFWNEFIKKYRVKNPATGKYLHNIHFYNLMFPISIHNKGSTNQKVKNYLRKDLKQNIYCNFNRLLQVNRNKLPFAAAQIGQVFRNEIYPKSVLRVREFTSTEIICFFNPNRDMHPRMDQVKHVMVPLLTRENQTMSLPPMDFSIEDVLNQQFVNSPIQAYYIAKVKLFMDLCGVLPNAIRFRQHLSHEMSFSTTDHWSCELKSSLGWIEVVDIVNNYCYDLKCHSSQSRHVLVAFETFDQPLTSENIVMEVEHEKLGKILRKNKRVVLNFLETLTDNKKLELQQELESNGKFSIYIPQLDRQVELSSDFISFQKRITKIYGYKYEPFAVETTFHIGRLIYSLLEQCFWVRKGNYLHEKMSQKYVLSLPTIIAPYMVVLISQISNRASSFEGMSKTLTQLFTRNGITFRVDNSANQTIGKKYSRADEIGIPFAVTIDNQSVECNTVTIRERDSCDQVRLPLDELVPTLLDLIHGNKSWEEVSLK